MKGFHSVRICALVLASVFAAALTASAQLTTGSVLGTVKDTQGGVIPGATVTLISQTRGTRSAPTFSEDNGDFIFANVTADTYIVEIAMASFKTLSRPNVAVSPGSRVSIGVLTIEVGNAAETIEVKAETPVIQAASGERSFTVTTEAVQHLPFSNRSFTALASLAPGVNGTMRIGATSEQAQSTQWTNFMMDGVSTMDTGSNGAMLQMNTESIAEVKVLTSGYQAEYGRSSGLQITAVTKSGTNQFRGSLYDVERNSDWNSNSRTNILNGLPKPATRERDYGYSVGGPIGKPGGSNKLFFFHALEMRPRTGGNDVVAFRLPTALERQGDFSQSRDNNGNLYPYIRDPQLAGVCTAADTTACFRAGGVLGRIPADRLYQPGLAILRMWPEPNNGSTQVGRNHEITRPSEEILGYQPAVRVDYQPFQSLRISVKYQGALQRQQTFNGTLPGFNDSKMVHPRVGTEAVTVNYNLSSTMFLEATYGRAGNQLAGCGPSPSFCGATAIPTSDVANWNNTGLASLPLLYPDAGIVNPDYYAHRVLTEAGVPVFDGTRLLKPPDFQWGNRVAGAPPNVNFPGFLNLNTTQDVSISVTKVAGRHTFKAGFYNTHSLKQENNTTQNFGTLNFANDTVGTNPFDTSFGFANAAIGSFSAFTQADQYVEGSFVYRNTEGYVQDNWKASDKLTLDYGVRFVHAQPQHDKLLQSSNFLPDRWSAGDAPALYLPGCANGVYPCSSSNRQALNPLTGQFLGPNSALAIGTIVPNSGNLTNGIFQSGQGIAKTTYTYPMLNVAPRFGAAYDISGKQSIVLRGAFGLYHDRPRAGNAQALVGNPPTTSLVTVRFSQLQNLGQVGLTTEAPRALTVFEYDARLPTSIQWNAGVQMMLPWATSLDVSYIGQRGYNDQQAWDINTIDLGTAYLASTVDPTVAATSIPGSNSLAATSPDLVRAYQGYGTMASTSRFYEGWRKSHQFQWSANRRFRDGLQFGFNHNWLLYDVARVLPRFDHGADGQYVRRADEAQAQDLLGNMNQQSHIFKGSVVWDLPDLPSFENRNAALRGVRLLLNDWLLSSVWTGMTGANYTVSPSYQSGNANVNLTGSPDFAPRIRIVGDPGAGCSDDPYRQFDTAAFQGPLPGSVGLESGNDYLRGCFSSVLDLSIARNIRLGGTRALTLRVDIFNAPNQARVTDRNTTLSLANPSDPVTPQNLPFDANGNLLPNRVRPNQAGFGAVSAYQSPRTVQAYIRFSF